MPYTILFPENVAPEGKDYLRGLGYQLKEGRGIDRKTLIEDLRDCDGVVVRVAPVDDEVFRACPRLKVVSKHGVGVDNIDLEAAKKYGRVVVNVPTANTLSVAEQAMTLILACAKKLNRMTAEYRAGNFAVKDAVLTGEAAGKTLGLLGFGRIGRLTARMAGRGFSMRVLAYDPFLPPDAAFEDAERTDDWEKLFRESDFVSIHIPATAGTEKAVGEREFRLMKTTAYLVNTSRGKIVDEKALIAALRAGEIAGAGLDVTEAEPADPGSPLFGMPNVILTPHNAACTAEAMVRMSLGAAQGIHEVLSGGVPTYKVV